LRYGIVDGIDMRDSRAHNYPPRWNAAPNQDLLVIRRNHDTGIVSLDPLRWGLIPHLVYGPERPPSYSSLNQLYRERGSKSLCRSGCS